MGSEYDITMDKPYGDDDEEEYTLVELTNPKCYQCGRTIRNLLLCEECDRLFCDACWQQTKNGQPACPDC